MSLSCLDAKIDPETDLEEYTQCKYGTLENDTAGDQFAIYITANITAEKQIKPAVSSVAKRTRSVRKVWGLIPGPVKSTQCRQRLATVATFLRSCVAQALSRGDGPRNSLHASANYGEYNEDLT